MAEALLTTRGEKGDTGAKGDRGPQGPAGTPSASQAPSLLGFSSTTSGSINYTSNSCSLAYSSRTLYLGSISAPSNSHGIVIIRNLNGRSTKTSGDDWSWTLYFGGRKSGDKTYGVHSIGTGNFSNGSCYASQYVTTYTHGDSAYALQCLLDIPYSVSSNKPSGTGTFTVTGSYTIYYKTN